MRVVVKALLCASIVLSTAACDPVTERRYFTEGVGVDLYTSDRDKQVELQNQYVDFLCKQSGSECNWATFVQAGMNDIDQRCDGFLTWLDARRRDREPVLQEITAVSTAAHTIMTVSGASPKSLDIMTAAFGLASATYNNWNSRLLLAVNQSTVQEVVYSSQGKFRDKIKTFVVNDRPTAIYLLRNYLRLCLPTTIEANINTSTTLVQRGAVVAAQQNLVVSNVRSGIIRNVAAPVQRVVATAVPGEPTDPVVIAGIRKALCLSESGGLDDEAHKRLGIYLKSINQPSSEQFLRREMILLNRLIRKNQTASCTLFA